MSAKAFKDEKEFIKQFKKYIDQCVSKERFANIAGFCVFADITRETFYKQKEYYSDTYNKVRNMLEDETLQHNTYMAQLYIKNTFKYKDKQEIESNNVNHNLNDDVSSLSDKELEEKIKKLENKNG